MNGLDGFARLCCHEPHIELLSDPAIVFPHPAGGSHGSGAVAEVIVGSDVEIDCGELCDAYRVIVLRSGRIGVVYTGARRSSAGPGTAAVYQPEGIGAARWAAGSRLFGFKIDRCAVDDALSDALGRQLTSQIDFTSVMPITPAPPAVGSTCCCCSRSSFSGPIACSISRSPDCRSSTVWFTGSYWPPTIPTATLLRERHSWQPSRDSRRGRNHRRGSIFAFDRLLDRCALPCQCPFATARLPALPGRFADGVSA